MKIGLVLAGGGGKGAYQIGVMKALYNLDWAKHIVAVSGTSVGALNAALFVNNDMNTAEQMWRTIHPSKILSVDSNKITKHLAHQLQKINTPLIQRYTKQLDGFGIFSRSGLIQMIDESIDLQEVSSSKIPFYATCTAIPKWEKSYFQLNGLSPEKIKDILLASSAIPGVFSPVQIDGASYIDGGFLDNIPVAPIYELGCDVIIAVLLDRTAVIDKSLFPNAKIFEIVPQQHLGNLINGTLNFSSTNAVLRIQQGYEDAMQILQPVQQTINNEANFFAAANQMLNEERHFNTKRNMNQQLIQKNMDSLLQRMRGK